MNYFLIIYIFCFCYCLVDLDISFCRLSCCLSDFIFSCYIVGVLFFWFIICLWKFYKKKKENIKSMCNKYKVSLLNK